MPSLKPREVLSILFAHGFEKVRATGSHIRLKKGKMYVTIPYHSRKTLPRGTLSSIIRQSGLKKGDFIKRTKGY